LHCTWIWTLIPTSTSITAISERRLAHPPQPPLHLDLPTPLATPQIPIVGLICTQYNVVLHAYIPIRPWLATGAPRLRLVRPRLSSLLVCQHHPPRPPRSTPPRPHVCPSNRPSPNLSLVLPLSSPLASSLGISSNSTQTDSQSLFLCESPTASHYAILRSNWYVFIGYFVVHYPPRVDFVPYVPSFLLRAGRTFHHFKFLNGRLLSPRRVR